MKKNLLLILASRDGTIAKVSYNFYKGLIENQNLNVHVCSLAKEIDKKNEWDFEAPNIYFANSHNFLKRIFFLRNLKKKLQIDISISTQNGCSIWNILSSRGEKKIGIFHGPVSQKKFAGVLNYLSIRTCYALLFPFFDVVCGVSQTIYNDLHKIPRAKKLLLYNAHDFENILSLSQENIDKKEESSFTTHNILYVGGIYNVKAPERVIKAFNLLVKEKIEDVNLIFVGDGDPEYFEYIRNLVIKLNLNNRVHFLGRKNNPYSYMKKCDFLVSSSKSEGLPGVIIEALFLGLPVISTNSTIGVWEIMECCDDYTKNLNFNHRVKYGYITPNLYNNENYNIKMLSVAMKEQLKRHIGDGFSFNYSRFEKKNIVNYLLKNI